MSDKNENDIDISQGEMTASALEEHLNAIESKVEELLAGVGAQDMLMGNPETNGQNPEKDQKSEIKDEKQSR
ncbi:hypothetical protein N7450_006516 [Penicillium hetheringtonii]|uniref:Uncharacterized protein n=1 Tax=Penicillium hetheringtonii TaxID=911720 RepID=A0AAD6DI90_9EURO|nr:hypothetical protein N7450_006516 [Penicillium hetheringtonii]